MKRVILCLSVFLLLFLTLSSVQAEDVNITDISSQNPVNEKTFDAIQNTIDSSNDKDTILLEGTYMGSGKAITVNKSVTIKGTTNGATLFARSSSQILDIQADNVILENILFSSGYTKNEGGAIYSAGSNLIINKCNFTSNSADYGGAILSTGDNTSIRNCVFTKNSAVTSGGAFELQGNNAIADNCVFKNNNAGHAGGSVSWVGDNGTLTNSVFNYNLGVSSAPQFGGAVVWIGANGKTERCIFNENVAKMSGAAVYWRENNGSLNYCIFNNNTSGNDSAYCGNPDYANYNYWGADIASEEEFLENGFIFYGGEFKAPENWVNIVFGKDMIEFKLNNGETLKKYLPDYQITVSGNTVVISKNRYIFKKNTVIQASNIVSYNNGKYFKITLKDINSKILADKSVQIRINKVVYNVKTDNKGVARLKLKTLPPKSYVVRITFNGDDWYKSTVKSVKLTVKKQKTSLKDNLPWLIHPEMMIYIIYLVMNFDLL